mmetsp:Transcript_7648/g.12379  ORF Transcript_7648/g.12379 Transcript_7648/m.12379 type:complete len:100 (-) Transcript_7648:123-422(-)
MEINLDRWRILHLLLLLTVSSILAQILIAKFEWAALSAYGFAITITTQINNAINSDQLNGDLNADDAADKMRQEKRERVLEKRKERRKGGTGVTGKKKK